jgi:pimeloyl-ACP methyl ester carboxylesterase
MRSSSVSTMARIADDLVRLSRGRMRVVASVQGDPSVVLLHGWPGFSIDYRHVLPLVARRTRAVAPDLLGFGGSDAPAGRAGEVADERSFARDVLELLDALALARPVLVGHDVGSAVAAAVARLAPEGVRGLVLMNPTHPFIGEKRWTPRAQREAWYRARGVSRARGHVGTFRCSRSGATAIRCAHSTS